MKITVQTFTDAPPAFILEAENEPEMYQLSSITRTLEQAEAKIQRWNNETGRGITVGIMSKKERSYIK